MKKYNKLLLAGSTLAVLSGSALAEERSYEDIKNVAVNFAQKHDRSVAQSEDEITTSTSNFTQLGTIDNSAYRIIKLQPKGWVIVSGDDIAKPILGYSLEGTLNSNTTLPEAFVNWMKVIEKQIKEGKESGITNAVYEQEWTTLTMDPAVYRDTYVTNDTEEITTSTKQVGPLLRTRWAQGQYYNSMCPADTNGPNGHALVGCAATATGQIMRYHSWPDRGRGRHTDTQSNYGNLTVNFATNYNWSAMPEGRVTSSHGNVAKLLYHVGVSIDMMYGSRGSGAYPTKISNALRTYFKYDTGSYTRKSSVASDAAWDNILKRDLDKRLPILYNGWVQGGSGGHSFVCDGYQYNNASKRYHFNWGWNGYMNGWFAIGALNVAGTNFNRSNSVLVGIKPKKTSHIYVGIIPETKSCPVNSKLITIYMDDEDSENANRHSGWLGAINQSTNTKFTFCKVDGQKFKNLRKDGYAVLKLDKMCPSGSQEFSRYFDNEDNRNANSHYGNITPNVSNANTTLYFCYFPARNSNTMSSFPNLGIHYGVFSANRLSLAQKYGYLRTDDEDNGNNNKYYTHNNATKSLISDGTNTAIRIAKVK